MRGKTNGGEGVRKIAVNQSSRLKNFIDCPAPVIVSQQVIILGNTGVLLFSPIVHSSVVHTERN